MSDHPPQHPQTPFYTPPRPSATFDAHSIDEIQRAAATGIYDIRGAGAKRKVPHFDDLLFLGASISATIDACAASLVSSSSPSARPLTRRSRSRTVS